MKGKNNIKNTRTKMIGVGNKEMKGKQERLKD